MQIAVRGRQTVEIRTGTEDSCWKLAKQAIPASVCSSNKDRSETSKAIWTYVRSWQQRWESVKHGFPNVFDWQNLAQM